MDPAALLAIPAVQKIIDVIRYIAVEHDWRKTAYAVGAWAAGSAVVLVVSQSSLGGSLFPEALNWADVVLYGVGLGASASVLNDVVRKAPEEGHAENPPTVIVNSPAPVGITVADEIT